MRNQANHTRANPLIEENESAGRESDTKIKENKEYETV